MAPDVAALAGIVPILPTPLDSDGGVDEDGVAHLVEHCVHEGMDGTVVLGSNGEFPYLAFDEKRGVMEAAVAAAGTSLPVVGTASACGTDEAVELARSAREVGCSAVMAAVPLYFAVDVSQLVEHLARVAREGGLPVFYYHFPEVTGLELEPADFATLAAIPGVVGTKLTVVNRGFLQDVIEATRQHGWRVFTGTSFLLPECLAAGGAGAFCPLPLLGPGAVRALFVAARTGDAETIAECRADLLRAIPLMSGIDAPIDLLVEGFETAIAAPYEGAGKRPAPTHPLLKAALRCCGHPISAAVRAPLTPATADQSALARRVLGELGWLDTP